MNVKKNYKDSLLQFCKIIGLKHTLIHSHWRFTSGELIWAVLIRIESEKNYKWDDWTQLRIQHRESRKREDIETYLNTLGSEGWELVNVDYRELEGGLEFAGIMKKERI